MLEQTQTISQSLKGILKTVEHIPGKEVGRYINNIIWSSSFYGHLAFAFSFLFDVNGSHLRSIKKSLSDMSFHIL